MIKKHIQKRIVFYFVQVGVFLILPVQLFGLPATNADFVFSDKNVHIFSDPPICSSSSVATHCIFIEPLSVNRKPVEDSIRAIQVSLDAIVHENRKQTEKEWDKYWLHFISACWIAIASGCVISASFYPSNSSVLASEERGS